MDVIDLCDDEIDEPKTKIAADKTPLELKLKSLAANDVTITTTKVHTNEATTSPAATTISRRKSILQPKTDDAVEIIEESQPKPSAARGAQYKILENPNLEVMRKVAKLRVLISHKLKEMGIDSFSLENDDSLELLKQQFQQRLNKN